MTSSCLDNISHLLASPSLHQICVPTLAYPSSSVPLMQVCAYNRTVEKVTRFLENEAKGTKVVGATSLKDMVSKLKKPRRVMMLVKAGAPVDAFIDKLVSVRQPWAIARW